MQFIGHSLLWRLNGEELMSQTFPYFIVLVAIMIRSFRTKQYIRSPPGFLFLSSCVIVSTTGISVGALTGATDLQSWKKIKIWYFVYTFVFIIFINYTILQTTNQICVGSNCTPLQQGHFFWIHYLERPDAIVNESSVTCFLHSVLPETPLNFSLLFSIFGVRDCVKNLVINI